MLLTEEDHILQGASVSVTLTLQRLDTPVAGVVTGHCANSCSEGGQTHSTSSMTSVTVTVGRSPTN